MLVAIDYWVGEDRVGTMYHDSWSKTGSMSREIAEVCQRQATIRGCDVIATPHGWLFLPPYEERLAVASPR